MVSSVVGMRRHCAWTTVPGQACGLPCVATVSAFRLCPMRATSHAAHAREARFKEARFKTVLELAGSTARRWRPDAMAARNATAVRFEVPGSGSVSGLFAAPPDAGACLVLAHGAG